MSDFDTDVQKERLSTEAARAPRVSYVRKEGEVTVSEGLEAAEEAIQAAKEDGAARIICEVHIVHEIVEKP